MRGKPARPDLNERGARIIPALDSTSGKVTVVGTMDRCTTKEILIIFDLLREDVTLWDL